jgi:hypothetical protein
MLRFVVKIFHALKAKVSVEIDLRQKMVKVTLINSTILIFGWTQKQKICSGDSITLTTWDLLCLLFSK